MTWDRKRTDEDRLREERMWNAFFVAAAPADVLAPFVAAPSQPATDRGHRECERGRTFASRVLGRVMFLSEIRDAKTGSDTYSTLQLTTDSVGRNITKPGALTKPDKPEGT